MKKCAAWQARTLALRAEVTDKPRRLEDSPAGLGILLFYDVNRTFTTLRLPTRTTRPSMIATFALGSLIFSRSGPMVTAPCSTERRASLLLFAIPDKASNLQIQILPS